MFKSGAGTATHPKTENSTENQPRRGSLGRIWSSLRASSTRSLPAANEKPLESRRRSFVYGWDSDEDEDDKNEMHQPRLISDSDDVQVFQVDLTALNDSKGSFLEGYGLSEKEDAFLYYSNPENRRRSFLMLENDEDDTLEDSSNSNGMTCANSSSSLPKADPAPANEKAPEEAEDSQHSTRPQPRPRPGGLLRRSSRVSTEAHPSLLLSGALEDLDLDDDF